MQQIQQEITNFVKAAPTDHKLTDFINKMTPKLIPQVLLSQIDMNTVKETTLVYARVMVQDIRDMYFYISFAMKRPFEAQKQFYMYKYGNIPGQQNFEEIQQDPNYMHVMTERCPVICTPVLYESPWVGELQQRKNKFNSLTLQVDGKSDFKLGEIINVVAFYDPEFKKLFYVRSVDEQEAKNVGLDPLLKLPQQLNIQETRAQLMNFLCQYCSPTMAEFLLITILSDQPIFLGCQDHIQALIELIYPRVAHIKIIHPCNDPLFPYKNEQGELIQTPMQLSILPTFVIIDLSHFTTQNQVQITAGEVDNFNALKLFVEDGRTIYKWEMGESHFEHKHRGVIIKGSKLITPHYFPKDQCISPDFSQLKQTPQALLDRFRKYLLSASEIRPQLGEEQRQKIEKKLAQVQFKQKVGGQLAKIMQITKLLAKSHGRSEMLYSDYQRAQELFGASEVAS